MSFDAGVAVAQYRLQTEQARAEAQSLAQSLQGIGKAATAADVPVEALVAELRQAALAAQLTETRFLELAGAMSQQALAAGDAARAELILADANRGLNISASASGAAVKAASDEAKTAGGAFTNLSGALSAVGIGFTLVSAAKGVLDLAQTGAQAQLLAQRFEGVAAAANTTSREFLGVLRAASHGEIADTALELDVMKARLLGVGDSAAEIAPLLALARDRAQQMGLTTDDAFERLVRGLGRGSAKILDDLGIIVHITEINDKYAASIGKVSEELTDEERKHALIQETLRQAAASAEQAGGAIDSNASSYQRAGAALSNFKDFLGGVVSTGLRPYADSIAQAQERIDQMTAAMQRNADWQRQLHGATEQRTQITFRAADADDRASQASQGVSSALEGELRRKIDSTIQTAELAARQAQLDADSRAAAQGLLGAGDQALILAQKYGIAASQAQFLIQQQQAIINKEALADQRKGEQTGTTLSAREFNNFSNLQRQRNNELADEKKKADEKAAADKKRADEKAAADAKRLQDAQNQLRLASATTTAAKPSQPMKPMMRFSMPNPATVRCRPTWP